MVSNSKVFFCSTVFIKYHTEYLSKDKEDFENVVTVNYSNKRF